MKRPVAVSVVAGFLAVATVIAVVVAASLLFPGTMLDGMWALNRPAQAAFVGLGRWSGMLMVVLASVTSSAAWGLLRGRRWAWWMAMAVFLFDGMGDLVSVVLGKDGLRAGLGVVVAGVFATSLLGKSVRRFFGLGAS
jgi:hypothetical protein